MGIELLYFPGGHGVVSSFFVRAIRRTTNSYHRFSIATITQTRDAEASSEPEDRLEQFFFERFGDRARSRMDVKFAVNVPQVGIYCMIAQGELIGYLFFDQTLSHQF